MIRHLSNKKVSSRCTKTSISPPILEPRTISNWPLQMHKNRISMKVRTLVLSSLCTLQTTRLTDHKLISADHYLQEITVKMLILTRPRWCSDSKTMINKGMTDKTNFSIISTSRSDYRKLSTIHKSRCKHSNTKRLCILEIIRMAGFWLAKIWEVELALKWINITKVSSRPMLSQADINVARETFRLDRWYNRWTSL